MAFGSSKSSKSSLPMSKSNGGGPASSQVNLIGEGTVIEGTFRAEGDVRVSGRVEGTMQVAGKVFVTQEGRIDGDLSARNADVAGAITGTVRIEERLLLHGTARVEADVETERLVMEEGASFNGACVMDGKASTPRPIAAATGSAKSSSKPTTSSEA